MKQAPASLAIPARLALEFDAETRLRGLRGGAIFAACARTWIRLHSGSQAIARDPSLRARNIRLSRAASARLDRAAYQRGVSVDVVIEELLLKEKEETTPWPHL